MLSRMSNYNPRPVTPENPESRRAFMAKVSKQPPPGCWDWRGDTVTGGYGRFRGLRAHRVIYAWTFGDTTQEIHHRCGNPACVNPDHLTTGDGEYRHRSGRETHCVHGHEFTPENTYKSKQGVRQCRACMRARSQAHREANREKVLARRRELRQRVQHEPRPCKACGVEFVPIRSTATLCPDCRSKPNPIRRRYMRDYMRAKRCEERSQQPEPL